MCKVEEGLRLHKPEKREEKMVVSIAKAQDIVLKAREREHIRNIERMATEQRRREQFLDVLKDVVADYCQESLNLSILKRCEEGKVSLGSLHSVGPNMIASWLKEKFELDIHTVSEWGQPRWYMPCTRFKGDDELKRLEQIWEDAWSRYQFNRVEGWNNWKDRPDGLNTGHFHIVLAFGEALTKVLTEAGYKVSNTLSVGLKKGCKEKQIMSGGIDVSWATGQLTEAS